MDEQKRVADENKNAVKSKRRMTFARFANLLYEASSSLVPGTGELYNTEYTKGEKDENTGNKTK